MQAQKRKKYHRDPGSTDDILTLIQLVRQNPVLYNYKMKPNRRSEVLSGWIHIAEQIGNRYTVEECRRKWKNLRDTYHQYRLRKQKVGEGLSRWRYAKELDFLANIYQPKLKCHREMGYNPNMAAAAALANKQNDICIETIHTTHDMVNHSTLTLVNDENDSYILTTFEDSVNDDVTTIDHVTHDDSSMVQIHLNAHNVNDDDNVNDVDEMVKNEHVLDEDNDVEEEDDGNGTEVDYEEVCMFDDGGHDGTVTADGNMLTEGTTTELKSFQYIDANDFCMSEINTHGSVQLTNTIANMPTPGTSKKFKASNEQQLTVVSTSSNVFTLANNSAISSTCNSGGTIITNANTSLLSAITVHAAPPAPPMPPATPSQSKTESEKASPDELDLYFEFLKKKLEHFSKDEVTHLQLEFINCILRKESSRADKKDAADVDH